jgi:hypothetical protein
MFMKPSSEFRADEWVEVRSEQEILATLDQSGQLDGLPFMPEMFAYCGKRFRVFKRAHKTCDPPNGTAGRRMLKTVHLEGVRCNGQAHGGCQALCLIFWKDAWLKRVNSGPESNGAGRPLASAALAGANGHCSRQDVEAATRDLSASKPDAPVFRCQSTQVHQASLPLQWWDVRQYIEDYTSGNVRLFELLRAFSFFVYSQIAIAGIGLGSFLRWIYDTVQKARGAAPYPLRNGVIPKGAKTPSARLDLKPQETVRIRSQAEILQTLDEVNYNRGMYFDPEMVPFTGGEYRVLARVNKIINEKTGEMMNLKNDCIILDEVVCKACYAKFRRFCPRSIYPYWREIWLDRTNGQCHSNSTHTRCAS